MVSISPLLRRQRWLSLTLIGWAAFISAWMIASSPQYSSHTGFVGVARRNELDASQSVTDLEIQPGAITKSDKIELEGEPASAEILNSSSNDEEDNAWAQKHQKVWKIMILFQHNLPILLQAIDSFRRGSSIMVDHMIIIDNSDTQEAFSNEALHKTVDKVIVTPHALNFPQLHNFMADTAMDMGLEFYFWAHADNYVLPISPGRDLGKDVLNCMRKQIASDPNWGMLLFSYDHLAAYRTQTMVQVPWDPLVFQYGSECDVYGRIRDAGYQAKACKVHLSYDMKQVLNITDDMPHAMVKEILETDAQIKHGRNQWRELAMSTEEQEWRTAMKMASRKYLVEKWKQRGCKVRGLKCYRPWPYCPKCPQHIPDCFNKRPTRKQLSHIYKESRKVFADDPMQPIPFKLYQSRKKAT